MTHARRGPSSAPRRTPAEIAAEAASRALVLRPADAGPRHLATVAEPGRWRPGWRDRWRRGPTLLLAALAAGLLFGALAGLIGAWLGPVRHGGASHRATRPPVAVSTPVSGGATAAGPGTAASPAPATPDPAPCFAAVEQADTVISLLVGDVRDQRLESSLSQYVKNAQYCRKEAEP